MLLLISMDNGQLPLSEKVTALRMHILTLLPTSSLLLLISTKHGVLGSYECVHGTCSQIGSWKIHQIGRQR